VLVLETDRNYALLGVARLETTRFGASPIFVTLDYRRTTLPSPTELEHTPDLALEHTYYHRLVGRHLLPAGRQICRARQRDLDFAEVGLKMAGHLAQRTGDAAIDIGQGTKWTGAAQAIADGSWYQCGHIVCNESTEPPDE
jgi:hypothetical protein